MKYFILFYTPLCLFVSYTKIFHNFCNFIVRTLKIIFDLSLKKIGFNLSSKRIVVFNPTLSHIFSNNTLQTVFNILTYLSTLLSK